MIHNDPDPVEGTPHKPRPEMPVEPPSCYEKAKRTPEPMVYFTSSRRFRVHLSYLKDGVWRQTVKTVDTLEEAVALRDNWRYGH